MTNVNASLKEMVNGVFERQVTQDTDTRYGEHQPLWNCFPPGIAKHDIMKDPTALTVLMFIWGNEKTFGDAAILSIRDIANGTGLPRQTVHRAIRERLIDRWGLLYARPGTKATRYWFVPQAVRYNNDRKGQATKGQREFDFMNRFDQYYNEQGELDFDADRDTLRDNHEPAPQAGYEPPTIPLGDASRDTSRTDIHEDISHMRARQDYLIPESYQKTPEEHTLTPGGGGVCASLSAFEEPEPERGDKFRGRNGLSPAEMHVLKTFRKLWEAKYKAHLPKLDRIDFARIKQLARDYEPDYITELVGCYLADPNDWLNENRHPVERLNTRNQNKYAVEINEARAGQERKLARERAITRIRDERAAMFDANPERFTFPTLYGVDLDGKPLGRSDDSAMPENIRAACDANRVRLEAERKAGDERNRVERETELAKQARLDKAREAQAAAELKVEESRIKRLYPHLAGYVEKWVTHYQLDDKGKRLIRANILYCLDRAEYNFTDADISGLDPPDDKTFNAAFETLRKFLSDRKQVAAASV